MPIKIISTGSYLPNLVVTNDDLAAFLDTNDEWITSRSGIKTRYIATEETTSDLGIKAAEIALKRSGLTPSDINLVVCATVTPDSTVPAVAANIKKGLGIESAAAFDLNGNCTGFVYAVTVAESLMKNCGYKNAIVIGADTNSQIVDWNDRSTCVLFGDGAGAVVLSDTNKRGIISSHLDCRIDTEEALSCNYPIRKTPFNSGERLKNTTVTMKGQKVMRFAVRAMIDSVATVLRKANISIDDIKYIIPHQANLRIIEAASKTLDIDPAKIIINIDRLANTSSATIPIALDEVVSSNKISRGDLLIFVAFGGGLTTGALLVEW